MHDSAYFGSPPDLPSLITLPAIPGTVEENNFGEFGTRLFIFQHTRDQDRSIRASNGWDGDRYALVKTPEGNALVWATVWDTPSDAAEFMSAIDEVMAKRYFVKPRSPASGGTSMRASGRSTSTCVRLAAAPSCCTSTRRPACRTSSTSRRSRSRRGDAAVEGARRRRSCAATAQRRPGA